jgi:uncharacterized protein (DUF2384 family)
MKRHAVKTSSEIGNEHFSAINDVWSEITGKSKLAALCPNSRPKFKESFKDLLDIPDGVSKVRDLLGRIEYGVYS